MHTKMTAIGFLTWAVLVVGCSSKPQARWHVIVMNMGETPLDTKWDDTAPGVLKSHAFSTLWADAGKHNLVARSGNQVVNQVELAIDPAKDQDVTYVMGLVPTRGYAVIDVSGAYSGGGIFSITDDKTFPIVTKHKGEKLIRLDTRLVFLAKPGEKLPDSAPSMYKVQALCVVPLESFDDDTKIRESCLARLLATRGKRAK